MELQKLGSFVLLIVLVGMVIGVGIVTLDKFSGSTFYSYTNYNDTITTANGTVTLDKGNVTLFRAIWNSTTNLLPAACYTTDATAGTITLNNQTVTCQAWAATMYIIYDYKDYDTETRSAADSVNSEVSGIASNWLGLIVTVSILAIVLFLVVRAFGIGVNGVGRR